NKFLNDFRRTIADLVHDNHYALMAEYAKKFGMGIQPESGGPHCACLDGLQNFGLNSMPMSEFWVPSPHRPTDEARFFVKQASSAAPIYGKPIACAEGFTSIGPQWNDLLWCSQKPSFDHEACAGLNLVFWHAFTCSPPEMGLPGQEYFAGTHFNPQITWAKQAHAFISYLDRSQFLLQRGKFVGDVCFYYGDHVPNFVRLKKDDPAKVLPEFDYDVCNEEVLLTRMSVQDGRLVLPNGMSYRVLALPNVKTMSLAAARKIRELVLAGATIIGPKPERTTGRQDDAELKKIADELFDSGRIKPQPAKKALAALGVKPDVEGVADWIHRRDGDADIYFVCNQKAEPVSIAPIFRVSGKQPELWDAVTGARRAAAAFTQADGRTTVPLELPPYGAQFVIFQKPATANGTGNNFPALTKVGELAGAWQVTFDAKWGAPASVEFEKLVSWTERPEPGIKAYSGTATYRKTFDLPSAISPNHLFLNLGNIGFIADVRLNGKKLGVVWAAPFQIEISGAVKPTGNVLEVDVVNGWWNRVLADEALPADQRMTKTNIRIGASHNRDKPQPQPAGLLGPVTLLQEK
ncbi:MAG: glycosyl hydrolase, partial [Kiritimatiellaeota bacterium]|nr:glycosyl hydrolase [Kiritimatiellota bacterium]